MNKEVLLSILWQVTEKEVTILDARPIGGGNVSRSYAVKTNEGNFFIKTNRVQLVDMFDKEVQNLDLLRQYIPDSIPEVLGYGTIEQMSFIVLKLVEAGKRIGAFWEDFGRTLASLHQVHHTHFGLHYDNYIGSLYQSNTLHTDWITFFIEQRIWPQAHKAEQLLGTDMLSQFEKLCQRLPELLTQGKPTLLHGDLWSGNFTMNQMGKVCLVDPSSYYGNREIELAFTKLFGGFDDAFYSAYQEIVPVDKGFFDTRMDIYNLYPLLVHVNLFGGWYISSVRETLKKLVK